MEDASATEDRAPAERPCERCGRVDPLSRLVGVLAISGDHREVRCPGCRGVCQVCGLDGDPVRLSRTLRCPDCFGVARNYRQSGAYVNPGSPIEFDPSALAFVAAHPDGATLEQVGEAIGLTRERVRQIEASALRNLRHALERQGVPAEDVVAFLAAKPSNDLPTSGGTGGYVPVATAAWDPLPLAFWSEENARLDALQREVDARVERVLALCPALRDLRPVDAPEDSRTVWSTEPRSYPLPFTRVNRSEVEVPDGPATYALVGGEPPAVVEEVESVDALANVDEVAERRAIWAAKRRATRAMASPEARDREVSAAKERRMRSEAAREVAVDRLVARHPRTFRLLVYVLVLRARLAYLARRRSDSARQACLRASRDIEAVREAWRRHQRARRERLAALSSRSEDR